MRRNSGGAVHGPPASQSIASAVSRRTFLLSGMTLAAAGCAPGRVASDVVTWGSEGFREGAFLRPRAIAVSGDDVYVIDTTGRIQVFSRDGDYAAGWRMPEHENGTPTALTIARDGHLLVPDTHYSRILEFTPDGEIVAQWGTYGSGPGNFIYPTGIVESPNHTLYICEYGDGAERVQVFTRDGSYRRTWGAFGDREGEFNRAMDIAMDRHGLIHVADTANHRIQVFTDDGTLERVVGAPGTAPGELKFPHDIAVADDDSCVVCEYGTNRISRFAPDGAFMGLFGGPGRAPGRFNAPRGVAVSGNDVFVADTDNHRIQRFSLDAIA